MPPIRTSYVNLSKLRRRKAHRSYLVRACFTDEMNAAGYRDRIGKGVEDSVVEQARDVLQDADILPVYNHFKVDLAFEAFFPYPYGKVVADAWLAVQ